MVSHGFTADVPACIGTAQDRTNSQLVTTEGPAGPYLSYLNY